MRIQPWGSSAQSNRSGDDVVSTPSPGHRQWAFNLWEFDPAKHQTLRELFDTAHQDIWKVLFKSAEVPPPLTEDRGLSAMRHANPVSSLYLIRCFFPQYNRLRDLSLH